MPKYRVRVTRDVSQYVDVVVAVDLPAPVEIAGSKYVPDAIALAESSAMKLVGDHGENTDAWQLDDNDATSVDVAADPEIVDDFTPVGVIREVAKPDPTATAPTLYIASIESCVDDIVTIVMTELSTHKSYVTNCPAAGFARLNIEIGKQFLYAAHSGAQEPLREIAEQIPTEPIPLPGQFPRIHTAD